MNQEQALETFRQSGAIITNSHIVYVSGKHGDAYINKDALYPDTVVVSNLCREIALRFQSGDVINTVIAPAIGGVILSQWVAHHLSTMQWSSVASVYAESVEIEEQKVFIIRRGYDKFVALQNVLVVEDILNTGATAAMVIHAVRKIGGNVVGLGALCNRGGVTSEDVGGVPILETLVNISLDSWSEEDCPMCKSGVPINTNVGHGRIFLERQKKQ